MRVLGIESTAHTLGIGIFDNGIKANVWDTFEGPYLPRDLAEHHAQVFPQVLEKALKEAGLSFKDIDRIAVAKGPGIGAPLSFGVAMANYLASKHQKEIVGVNHGWAHIKIVEYVNNIETDMALYVSGGNTQIIRMKPLKVVGETLDMGIGNMLDKAARELGLKNAAELEALALQHKDYIPLPYTVKGMHTTFAGIFTHFKRIKDKHPPEDLAYSLMHTSYAMLLETLARAMFAYKAKKIVVCGGVAQSKILKTMLQEFQEFYDVEIYFAPNEYNRDNGAMIAYAGSLLAPQQLPIIPDPYFRVDKS
ncbi:MAG: tRNA (adenosine(37)-N6)-threonylcarbamoyltransferase complex transferase subunit TsaD [Candidatus Micrarchaeota archaeon]|nr:tRNA (adenosine(37)-N6)-threonylcarbamoyltransferase complex transferase subunit TsaD [Candidatus Micrarchaeota archaeon]